MTRRGWGWAGALLLVLAALALWAWAGPAARARGEALFDGRAAVPGRLVGHDADLPPAATRCANCHEAGPRSGANGPRLDAATLAQPRVRRGGPASAYDARRLCDLLRDGTDPAHVIIATTMPRYAATDAQCADLWAWISAR